MALACGCKKSADKKSLRSLKDRGLFLLIDESIFTGVYSTSFIFIWWFPLGLGLLISAWAAASLAMGTLNGEHDT